jgi:prephenate dehydrogenase
MATKILNRISEKQIVMDMGSTKQELCEVTMLHPRRGRLVATHPMWGTENSGPEAAEHNAFKGRTVVICEKEHSDEDALQVVEHIYQSLGMPIRYMSAEEQDTHCAYVSHISHITSFALALTVLEKEREEEHIFDLAAGGFESTVRLAKSLPQTWAPIFLGNKYNVLDVLREHIHQLQILRRMIERDDREGLIEAMKRANKIREILK